MTGDELAAFTQEVMMKPYAAQLLGELAMRQPTSNHQVAKLRDGSIGNASFWPFHAVQLPVSVAEAEGSRIVDVDGNEYLDLFLGFGTQALHGHNPPEVVDAVRKVLGKSVGNAYFNAVELELVEQLRALAPANEAFVFLHSGTEATAAAVRICRAATGRRLVIKLESAVHGTHDWGVQSSVALMHGHPFTPWPAISEDGVAPVSFATGVPAPPRDDLLILPHDVDAALALLERHAADAACVIAESCNISFPFPDKCVPLTKALATRCQELGVKFVLDEVQTGFRWGPGGAAEAEDIPADLRVYGKVLSGLGIPLSAVGGDVALLDHARTTGVNLLDYGRKTTFMTTHMGHHLALVASHASLSLLADKGPAYYARVRARVASLRHRLAALREDGVPLHSVGYGDFIGMFLFGEQPHDANNARQLATRVNPAATILLSLALRRRGLYTYSWPFLFLGDAYSDDDFERITEEVVGAAEELLHAGIPLTAPWAR